MFEKVFSFGKWTIIAGLGISFLSFECKSLSAAEVHKQAPRLAVPVKSPQVYAIEEENSSIVYVHPAGATAAHRLTANKGKWESDPVLSANGELIAYATAEGPEARSEVWVAHLDGSHAHRVSASDEDAIMPAFAPDGKTLLYVRSQFNGHYSPIARPRRHKFDVMKVLVDTDGPIAGVTPVELTHQNFFDMRSLNVSPDGEHFLVSTSGYPIGSLIEEFEISNPLEIHKIFQPRVPGEPRTGPTFGTAVFVNNGMDIVFAAATEGAGGNFDYNVYRMSDVTGGELVLLGQHAGVINSLTATADGAIYITGKSQPMVLDSSTKSFSPQLKTSSDRIP